MWLNGKAPLDGITNGSEHRSPWPGATHRPLASQVSAPSQPGSQVPPQPSSPHSLPAQAGTHSHVAWSALQTSFSAQPGPQVPSQPSVPQTLPSQAGTHGALLNVTSNGPSSEPNQPSRTRKYVTPAVSSKSQLPDAQMSPESPRQVPSTSPQSVAMYSVPGPPDPFFVML